MTYDPNIDLPTVCQGYLEQWLEENAYECDQCGLHIIGEPGLYQRMTPDETLTLCPDCLAQKQRYGS